MKMPDLYLPQRILERNTGGNTTYTRALADGLKMRGWNVQHIPAGGNPVATMLRETAFGRRDLAGSVLHYSADTGPLLKTKGRSVVTVHGIASRWTPVARNRRQEAIWRGRVARAISSCDRVITVSQSSADDVAAVFEVPRAEIAVIPHGIDTPHFAEPAKMSSETATQLPPRFALYVGNIEPRKNVKSLVQAFEDLDIPLVVAGRFAWNFDEAAAEIERSTNTIYLGYVSDEDRRALMQACTLFVFPSLYEGFGFPVLEAMAAGAPVLTSNAGSLAEVAGPARRLEALTPEGIKESVVKALGDSEWTTKSVPEGRLWASQFSWDRSVEDHIAVYLELLRA